MGGKNDFEKKTALTSTACCEQQCQPWNKFLELNTGETRLSAI